MPAPTPTRKLRVLFVDDNPDTIRLVSMLLKGAGHTVLTARGGQEALQLLQREPVEMIMLDVMMPGMDGFSLLNTIRKTSDAPILMVTALSDQAAIQRGFQLGADDYIVKPFSPEQLFSRLERLTGQVPPPPRKNVLAAGQFSLDLTTDLLRIGDSQVELTDIEAKILQRLLKSPGRSVAVEDLYRTAWGQDPESNEQSLSLATIAVNRLRNKIEPEPNQPRYIVNVAGIGYQLNVE